VLDARKSISFKRSRTVALDSFSQNCALFFRSLDFVPPGSSKLHAAVACLLLSSHIAFVVFKLSTVEKIKRQHIAAKNKYKFYFDRVKN
jgi:hypothetical protein